MTEGPIDPDTAWALVGLACCFFVLLAVVGLVVWLVVRSAKGTTAVMPTPVPPQPMHLSVLALSFEALLKARIEQALAMPSLATDAAAQRVELVQRTTRALLELESHWRDFGYGEKDLAAMVDARTSFAAAVSDFRARAQGPGDGGPLVVLTLIIATRTLLTGVSSLDDRQQVRAVLENRAGLVAGNLLGADLVWSPSTGALSEPAVRARFPEMAQLRERAP